MKIENDGLILSFEIVEHPTVRQQLKYRSDLVKSDTDNDLFSQHWAAALPLISKWECALLPDPTELDIDNETNPQVANLVEFVSMSVFNHIQKLDAIEKKA